MRLLSGPELEEILHIAKRIAVLGIKPESRKERDAHTIPGYLHSVGYEIIPVPVYYPEVTEIFGSRVYRRLTQISGKIDIINIFRKPEDIGQHVNEIISVQPDVVWFQSGLMDETSAIKIARADIKIAHECIGCRRAVIHPSALPLVGQRRAP